MTEVNQDATLIEVHGRAGLNIPYTRFRKTAQGREEQVDLSTATIFLEVPAAKLRKELVTNPTDSKALLIQLTRDEVGRLPVTPTSFAVIDETTDFPEVEWEGMIVRTGYTGDPSV